MLHYTALHITILHYSAIYCTILYYPILCCTILCFTALYLIILYCTVLYRILLHYTALCCSSRIKTICRSTYVLKQYMGEPLIYRCVRDTFFHFCSADFPIHVYYVKLIKSGPKNDPERGGALSEGQICPSTRIKKSFTTDCLIGGGFNRTRHYYVSCSIL